NRNKCSNKCSTSALKSVLNCFILCVLESLRLGVMFLSFPSVPLHFCGLNSLVFAAIHCHCRSGSGSLLRAVFCQIGGSSWPFCHAKSPIRRLFRRFLPANSAAIRQISPIRNQKDTPFV